MCLQSEESAESDTFVKMMKVGVLLQASPFSYIVMVQYTYKRGEYAAQCLHHLTFLTSLADAPAHNTCMICNLCLAIENGVILLQRLHFCNSDGGTKINIESTRVHSISKR